MALSDAPREANLKRNVNRAIEATTNKRWSDKQKMEALTTFLALGNLSLTGRVLGIPEITLRVWKRSNWWTEAVADLKSQERIELSNKLKRIVDAAHAVVENRLTNGDAVVIPKTGEIVFKPVSMKDAHRVAVDLQNQREVVEKLNKPVDEVTESNTDKLEQLAEKFAEFATKKIEQKFDKRRTIEGEVTDVTLVQHESLPSEILSGGRLEERGEVVEEGQGSHP